MGKMPALAVIGGGNMASAIIEGGLAAGVLTPNEVLVSEPDLAKHAALTALGAKVTSNSVQVMEQLPPGGQLLLAVKPQLLKVVAEELAPLLRSGRWPVLISILAGTRSSTINQLLGGHLKVVRAMPNTPARLRRGMTALSLGKGASESDVSFATALFGSVGKTVRIDEYLMDAFTAVAASGPAYVFFLAQAMTRSAVELGFNESEADAMVRETIAGAGALLAATQESPSKLLAGVQSKGGTTEAAMQVLEHDHVLNSFVRALTAARDRGRELSR
jgi:pyrroline-5-carboxylate reductase